MTKKEIRTKLEQMDNSSVDLASIAIDGDTVSYASNPSGRNADSGWINGSHLMIDVESFEMFA